MRAEKSKILLNINKNLKLLYDSKKNQIIQKGITLSEPNYSDEEAIALLNNFIEGNISQGKNVKKFEKSFSKKLVANMELQQILVHLLTFLR